MKSQTIGIDHVNKYRLLDWVPRDYCNQCLETLNEMAKIV